MISFVACKKDTEVITTESENELISENITFGDTSATVVLGCTDQNAENYNAEATEDDGSCTYAVVTGCTDQNAENYNAEATEDDGSCTYPISTNANIGDLMAAFAPESQIETFNFNEDVGGTLVTSLDTRFVFNPNSMTTLDNQMVDGMITIEIIELYSKADIIRFGAHTMSNGQVLRSAGEFLVKATQNGQELKIADGNTYNIQIPNNNPDPEMLLFDLDESGDLPTWIEISPNSQNNWVTQGEWEDSLDFGFGYYIITDRFSWINCDAFANYPPDELTTVSVAVPEEYTNTNTVVFLVFDDENTVIQLWGNPATMMFTSQNIPIGVDVTVIVMSSVGDETNPQFQYEVIETTTEADQIINSTPVDATIEEIEMVLDGI